MRQEPGLPLFHNSKKEKRERRGTGTNGELSHVIRALTVTTTSLGGLRCPRCSESSRRLALAGRVEDKTKQKTDSRIQTHAHRGIRLYASLCMHVCDLLSGICVCLVLPESLGDLPVARVIALCGFADLRAQTSRLSSDHVTFPYLEMLRIVGRSLRKRADAVFAYDSRSRTSAVFGEVTRWSHASCLEEVR